MLTLTLKHNEIIRVGEAMLFIDKKGNQLRIHIDAPQTIRVARLKADIIKHSDGKTISVVMRTDDKND